MVPRQVQSDEGASGKSIAKSPVIDNRWYPSSEQVGKMPNVPTGRVRQLKALAEKIVSSEAVQS